jgi:hypothetical protein
LLTSAAAEIADNALFLVENLDEWFVFTHCKLWGGVWRYFANLVSY